MASYKFVGEVETIFADIKTALGETLKALPGDVYELEGNPSHPLLESVSVKPDTNPPVAPDSAPVVAPQDAQ